MRTLLIGFALLLAVLTGGYGVLWLQGAGLLATPRPRSVLVTDARAGASNSEPVQRDESALAALEHALSARLRDAPQQAFEPLAVLLEEAAFDRDWDMVELTAKLIREQGHAWSAGLANTEHPNASSEGELQEQRADAKTPLVVEAAQAEHRLAEQALRSRINAATLLLDRTDPDALSRLGVLLETSPDEQVRQDAAWLLSQSGDERALNTLERALRHPESATRRAAAVALARQEWLSGARALAEILRTEADPALRLDAAWGLSNYRAVLTGADHPATRALIEALAYDRSEDVRAAIATALGRADLEHAASLLEALTARLRSDPSPAVRRAAAKALAAASTRLGAGSAVRQVALSVLENENDPEVARTLLEVLQLGDRATLAALDRLASSRVAELVPEALARTRTVLSERLEAGR